MNIIEVSNLTASYNLHVAVEKINLNIKEKEFVCIVGENGSGKSTLIKCIVGLHKQDKGNVKLKIDFNEISYLEQINVNDLKFPATVKEVILTGLQTKRLKLFYEKSDYKKLEDVCSMLHIQNIINKRIGELSGGQRQRVMIARSIINNPKLLILDEPCSGLDKKISDKLYEILLDVNKNLGTTIIMATHNLQDIVRINEEKDINIRVIHVAKELKFDGSIKDWKGL